MKLSLLPHVKNPPCSTWGEIIKPDGNPILSNVCAGFYIPSKLAHQKLGTLLNKHKGLRRVNSTYVLADGAWVHPHGTTSARWRTIHVS